MKVQDQPLMLGVPPSCDHGSIRHLYADPGETMQIVRVATVNHPIEVSQEDMLTLAGKLAAAPWLLAALKACARYVPTETKRLKENGNLAAAQEAQRVYEDALKAIEYAENYRHSLHDEKMRELNTPI